MKATKRARGKECESESESESESGHLSQPVQQPGPGRRLPRPPGAGATEAAAEEGVVGHGGDHRRLPALGAAIILQSVK